MEWWCIVDMCWGGEDWGARDLCEESQEMGQKVRWGWSGSIEAIVRRRSWGASLEIKRIFFGGGGGSGIRASKSTSLTPPSYELDGPILKEVQPVKLIYYKNIRFNFLSKSKLAIRQFGPLMWSKSTQANAWTFPLVWQTLPEQIG